MTTKIKILAVLVFLVALLARIYVLFYVTEPENAGPGWYGDVYHHWQIAYLSKTVGFDHGFLRLWDLRGLEYYWGLMHPLVLILGFTIFNTSSVLVPRFLSVICGSLAVMLVFLIVHKKFNLSSAIASALVFAAFPVTLFSDTIGMQEPLGLTLILSGIYLWPKKPGLVGVFLMLAGMVRSEYWIFSGLMVLFLVLRTKNTNRKITLVGGYILVMILYMKYLLDYTGNPIYPVWTAYLATFIGHWFADIALNSEKTVMQDISRVIFGGGVLALILVIWKKPKGTLYWLLGILNILVFSALHGIGAYVKGFEGKVLVDRLLAFPYAFLGSMLCVFLFYTIPHKILPVKIGHYFKFLSWIIVIVLMGVSMTLWQPIKYYYDQAKRTYASEIEFSNEVAKYYEGSGAILVPYGRAVFIYGLINKNNIKGPNIVSEFYDPFFYADKNIDPFSEWDEFREKTDKWFTENEISLMVAVKDGSAGNYFKMYEFEEGRTMHKVFENTYFTLFKITPTY